MAGLSALFNSAPLRAAFNQFQKDVDSKVIQSLQYIGEEFVNKARNIDTYKDRTSNLRASIGYIILAHGKVVHSDFQGAQEGKDKGTEVANEVALEHPYGYVLIGVAGMDYAAYVEAGGRDVITGSAPTKEMLQELLEDV